MEIIWVVNIVSGVFTHTKDLSHTKFSRNTTKAKAQINVPHVFFSISIQQFPITQSIMYK